MEQRPIGDNDVCPICQEEFLIKKLPITFCRLVGFFSHWAPYFYKYTVTSLDAVVGTTCMWNAWRYGWIIRYLRARKPSNVRSAERRSAHPNSSNRNSGNDSHWIDKMTSVYAIPFSETVVLNKPRKRRFIWVTRATGAEHVRSPANVTNARLAMIISSVKHVSIWISTMNTVSTIERSIISKADHDGI